MRLVEADVWGYRRFRDDQKMDLYPSLVCVVGPNAAGKSSFLDALTHLNDDRDFERWERTRKPAKDIIQVRGRFILDDADRAALADMPEAAGAREFVVWNKDDFPRGFRLEPVPERDLRARRDVRVRLGKLADHPWATANDIESFDDHLATALAIIGSLEQSLDADEIDAVSLLATELGTATDLPYALRALPERLRALTVEESAPHPHDAAIEILSGRLPQFTKFDVEDRDLHATYDVDAEPNRAILNLLEFGETSWGELRRIADEEERGVKVGWEDQVRETLARKLAPTWGQQELSVRLDLDGRVLKVLMSMQSGELLDIDQHSDGLRQFVALRAYMGIRGDVLPIVLIDEAETHLHYDAQADLIRVFEDQRDAAKIIYTTHSAGCLPHDLGTGIRAIVPVYAKEDGERLVQTDASEVENHFWTLGVGFQPLLLVLGASAFAFASTQRAVVCEGMSDALLLPTLIREATGVDHLPYQFCPGASEASRAQVADLDLVASRVVFLLDGDGGGRKHGKKVKRGGARPEQVIYLGSRTSGLGVEDLVTKEVFLEAVNGALGRGALADRLALGDVPGKGRAEALKQWCAAHPAASGKPVELSKTTIAERLLDQRHERPLLEPRHRKTLVKLDEELRQLLDLPTHKL